MPPSYRRELVSSGSIDPLLGVLLPGQRAALFPNYYKDNLSSLAGQRSEFGATGGAGGGGTAAPVTQTSPRTGTSTRINTSTLPSQGGPSQTGQAGATNPYRVKNVTGKQQAVLDMIAKREGAKDPNIIFGDVGGKAGSGVYSQQLRNMGYTKPLTEMTISEVRAMQKDLIKLTKGKIGKGDLGTSAVGSGQMIGSTLEANLRALNIPESDWDKVKFDVDLQAQLTLQNFKSTVGDPENPSTWNLTQLGNQWESFDTRKGFAPLSQSEVAMVNNASPEIQQDNSAEVVNAVPTATTAEATAAAAAGTVVDDTKGVGQSPSAEILQKGEVAIGSSAPDGMQDMTIGSTDTVYGRSAPGMLDNVDDRLKVVGDAAIRAFEKNNPGYSVRVISGERPGAKTSSGKPSKHALGQAIDYEIVGPDGKALPSLGQPDHPSGMGVGEAVGDSVPKYYELMKGMEAARVKMGEKDPSYIDMGQISPGLFFKGGAWMDSMHASFGEGGTLGDVYSGFKSPEQLRAEGTDPQIIRAVERAIAAGAPVQGQGEPMKEEDMKAYAEALYSGKGVAASEIAKEVTSDSNSFAELVDPNAVTAPQPTATQTNVPQANVPVQPASGAPGSLVDDTAPVGQSPIPQETTETTATPVTNTEQQTASTSTEDTTSTVPDMGLGTPILSMAGGGVLSEPHTAVNNRTGEVVNLGEVGTGGEAIVPLNKVRANDVGMQPYQLPSSYAETAKTESMKPEAKPMASDGDLNRSNTPGKNATGQQMPVASVITADHPIIPPSARKAYADAGLEHRFNNFSSIGTQYRTFGI